MKTVFKDGLFNSSSIKPAQVRRDLRPWTDDYSNLWQIVKLKLTKNYPKFTVKRASPDFFPYGILTSGNSRIS